MSTARATRYQSVYTSWWFGHAMLFLLCTGAVGAALFMEPSPEVVSLFGYDIPVLCGFRRVTGLNCLGCGMTRSFAFMAHLQVLEAFRANPAGPALFAAALTQPPWRAYRLVQGSWRRRARG